MRVGLLFGGAIVLVNLPRLVLSYLASDWLTIPWVTGAFLAVSAVGTSLVVTGGALYIVHSYTVTGKTTGFERFALLAALVSLPFLLTPFNLALMRQVQFPDMLASITWRDFFTMQGLWSVVSIAMPELVAYAIMVANGRQQQPGRRMATTRRTGLFGNTLSALDRAIAAKLAPDGSLHTESPNGQTLRNGNPQYPVEAARERRKLAQEERRNEIANLLAMDPNMPHVELARRFNVHPSTISKDVRALRQEGRLNGKGTAA